MNNQPTAPQDDRLGDEPFVSRQQYRQQQEQRLRKTIADQDNPHQEGDVELRRRAFADERADQEREEKVGRLRRRLNIVIVALVVAIIIVYLILFYVG